MLSALNKTVKQLVLLKPQHDACFLINPTASYPTIKGWNTQPRQSPQGRLSCLLPVLLAQAPDTSWAQGLSSLQINSAKTTGACECVEGDRAWPVPRLAHGGFWPCTSSRRHRRRQGQLRPHCQKQLCKQGPNELLGITLPAGQPFQLAS